MDGKGWAPSLPIPKGNLAIAPSLLRSIWPIEIDWLFGPHGQFLWEKEGGMGGVPNWNIGKREGIVSKRQNRNRMKNKWII